MGKTISVVNFLGETICWGQIISRVKLFRQSTIFWGQKMSGKSFLLSNILSLRSLKSKQLNVKIIEGQKIR